jgi:hypothetical protein
MKIKYTTTLFYFILSCFINPFLVAQNNQTEAAPNWVYTNVEDKYQACCFYEKNRIKDVTSDNFENKKEQLKNSLLQTISEKIQTTIKKLDVLETKQVQNKTSIDFQTNYSSKSNISSSVKLSSFEFEFWPKEFKKEVKYIVGYIKIEKSDLENQYSNLVKKDLAIVEGELEESIEYSNSNLNEISDRLNNLILNLENDLNILSSIGIKNDYSAFYDSFVELKKKKTIFLNKMLGKDFENKYRKANQFLNEKKCDKAYELLQQLLIINPSDERINIDKETALTCLESNLTLRLTYFENKGEYEKALVVLDSLTWLSPSYNRLMEKRKSKIMDGYFIKKFQQIDNVIETNVDEAKSLHASMNFYGTEKYRDKYNRYGNLINKKRKKIFINKFDYLRDNNNFREAAKILVDLSSDYGLSKNISKEIRSLNKKLETSIYKYEKKRLLSDRPHLFCFKLGYNYQTDPFKIKAESDTFKLKFTKINFFTPYYTFEMYRKFNISTNYNDNNRDKSTSNMIGFRAGYLNNKFGKIVVSNKDSIKTSLNDFAEFQLSSIFLNFFHVSYGLLFPVNSTDNIGQKIMLYTSNLGIKLRIWYFDLNANLRYNSDYKSPGNLIFETGVSLNVNFDKKFNAADKRNLKVKIQDWKN